MLDIPARLSFGYISQASGVRMGYLFVMIILAVYLPYFLLTKSVLKNKSS